MDELDLSKTVLAIVSSIAGAGGFYALVRRLIKRAGASGWEIGVWVARADLAALRKEAAEGRAAKARADAIAKEAEARLARATAVADHACEQCRQITRERDELALRIAKEIKP